MTAVLAASAALGGVALADDKCFDKSKLAYVECPSEEPVSTERNGLYIGARGGVMQLDDVSVIDGAQNSVVEYDQGFVAGGFIGFEFVNVTPGVDLRGETEIGYQSADVDLFNGVSGAGDSSAFYGFLNLYSDITLFGPVDLIVGAGVGYAQVELANHGNTALGTEINDDTGAFAYHFDAGLGVDLTDSLSIEALYRYSSFVGAEFDSANGTENDIDIDSHQGIGGIRYKF